MKALRKQTKMSFSLRRVIQRGDLNLRRLGTRWAALAALTRILGQNSSLARVVAFCCELTDWEGFMDKLMRPEDVAERCNYSVHSIRRLAAQDKIPHRRFGRTLRFDASEVEGWLLQIARGPKVVANWSSSKGVTR